jgi:hypothetical protein
MSQLESEAGFETVTQLLDSGKLPSVYLVYVEHIKASGGTDHQASEGESSSIDNSRRRRKPTYQCLGCTIDL